MNELPRFLFSGSSLDALGVAATLMTITGVWLQWHRPAHLAEVEEALKDGRLLPEEARQRARKIDRRAMACVLIGMALLILLGFAWGRSY